MTSLGLPLLPKGPTEDIGRLDAPSLPDALRVKLQERPAGPEFGEILTGFLRRVDGAQHRADEMVEALALGEPVDVHQVMLALTEASHAVHLALQVRGKVVEAYQELMRMPL
jgi:flagellar hook-basal body complex protein FliE